MEHSFGNNFWKYKEDYEKETGVKLDKNNIIVYIEYFKARMIDNQTQLLMKILDKLPKQ